MVSAIKQAATVRAVDLRGLPISDSICRRTLQKAPASAHKAQHLTAITAQHSTLHSCHRPTVRLEAQRSEGVRELALVV